MNRAIQLKHKLKDFVKVRVAWGIKKMHIDTDITYKNVSYSRMYLRNELCRLGGVGLERRLNASSVRTPSRLLLLIISK